MKLNAIDEFHNCSQVLRLPPEITGPALRRGVMRGAQAQLVIQRNLSPLTYHGVVMGIQGAPFARHGIGFVELPPSAAGMPVQRISGQWFKDSLIGKAALLLNANSLASDSSSSGAASSSARSYSKYYRECHLCRSFVPSKNWNAHKCPQSGTSPSVMSVPLRRRLAKARAAYWARKSAQERANATRLARDALRRKRKVPTPDVLDSQNPKAFLLSCEDQWAWFVVPANLDKESFERSSGHVSWCVVEMHLQDDRLHRCFSKSCRSISTSGRPQGCRHVRCARLAMASETDPAADCFSLHGFMALTGTTASLPPRRSCSECSQEIAGSAACFGVHGCRYASGHTAASTKNRDERQEGVVCVDCDDDGANANNADPDPMPGYDGKDYKDDEGGGDEDDEDDDDEEEEEENSNKHIAFLDNAEKESSDIDEVQQRLDEVELDVNGRSDQPSPHGIPSVHDIAGARTKATLVAWCREFRVPVTGNKNKLAVRLLAKLHPDVVQSNSTDKTRSRGAPRRVRQSKADARAHHRELLRHIKDSRCVNGSMCAAYQVEYEKAKECCIQSNITSDTAPVVPISASDVEEIIYAISIANERESCPVVAVGGGVFFVLRSGPRSASYSTHAGYNRVTLRLRDEALDDEFSHKEGEGTQSVVRTRVCHTCTCSEFRAQSATSGGKSRVGFSRHCLDILIVILSLCVRSIGNLDIIPDSATAVVNQYLRDNKIRRPMHASSQRAHDRKLMREYYVSKLADGSCVPARWGESELMRFHEQVVLATNNELRACADTNQDPSDDGVQRLSSLIQNLLKAPAMEAIKRGELDHVGGNQLLDAVINLQHGLDGMLNTMRIEPQATTRGVPLVLSLPDVLGDFTCRSCPKGTQLVSHGKKSTCHVIIGRVLLLNHDSETFMCSNVGNCDSPSNAPHGPDWTRVTGLFAVRDNWQVHVINLEDMTRDIRISNGSLTPLQVCHAAKYERVCISKVSACKA